MRTQKKEVVTQDEDFVTVPQSAQLLHVAEITIRKKLTSGELTRYKAGARTLLLKSEVLGLIRKAS
jgi:hypothetical protein